MNVLIETRPAPGIARLELNRPAQRHALDAELVGALHAAITRLDADAGCRAVLLAASGPAFCAGADLAGMRALADAGPDANLADAMALATLLQDWQRSRLPTLALVQGDALGGGLGLIAACDIALAVPRARLRMPEVRLGLIPAVISPYVVQAMGTRAAARFMLGAEWFSAARAYELGLVHEVVPEHELPYAGLALARELAAGLPAALTACKQLLRELPQQTDARRVAWSAQWLAVRRADPATRALLGCACRSAP